MREKLDEVITVREGNVEKRYTRRDALILRAIQGAFSNDKQMMQFVFKMDEGADEPEPFRVTAEDEAELDALLTSMTIGGSDEDDPK